MVSAGGKRGEGRTKETECFLSDLSLWNKTRKIDVRLEAGAWGGEIISPCFMPQKPLHHFTRETRILAVDLERCKQHNVLVGCLNVNVCVRTAKALRDKRSGWYLLALLYSSEIPRAPHLRWRWPQQRFSRWCAYGLRVRLALLLWRCFSTAVRTATPVRRRHFQNLVVRVPACLCGCEGNELYALH